MKKPMPLKNLINAENSISARDQELMIYGLTSDSRAVRKGYLFAAFSGSKEDGLAYVPEAIKKGACAVLTSDQVDQIANIAHLTDPKPRRLFALMASRFYQAQFPDARLPLTIAVTGTNGKTSVAMFTRHIWTMLGHRAACVGTLGVIARGFSLASPLTTPSADIIHRILVGLARRSFTRVILEASSHGLAQYRLDGVKLKAAVFTRLGEDHLDYHQSREDYLNAKLRLVREVLPHESLFICDDDAPGALEAVRAARQACHRILRVGGARSEIHLQDGRPDASGYMRHMKRMKGQQLSVSYLGKSYQINFPLVGRFQAINALLAAACVLGTEEGIDPTRVFAALETMPAVQGRLEKIAETKEGSSVYIDYAHTPDGLETALSALRASLSQSGRLVLVFGAGGDRDQSKRPRMGRVAEQGADRVIVTDDNPRFEDAASIRAILCLACPKAENIGDRKEAICAALEGLRQDDIVLIAGKGHERYQEREGRLLAFSDAKIVRELLG